MAFGIGFLIGAALVGAIWGYRGYLGRQAAAAEQAIKDAAAKALNKV